MTRRSSEPSCRCCAHPERARIDYLIASGATRRAVAAKFNVSADSVERHARRHISDEFRASVRLGPFKSEDELRALIAENSTSVVENLRAVQGMLSARLLIAYEAGADLALVSLTREMLRVLDMRARISRELAPPKSTVVNNVFAIPAVMDLQATLMRTLANYPEANRAVIAALREIEERSPPLIEATATATAVG